MPEEIVELRAARLVGRDHLAVENGLADLKLGRDLFTKLDEEAHNIAIARDEPAAALLDVAEPGSCHI